MPLLPLAAAVVAVALGAACAAGVRRRRWGSTVAAGMGCLLLAAAAALLGASDLHLRTYRRLAAESPAASIRFTKTGDARFDAELTLSGGGPPRRFTILGEEWQIDARILKWRPAAQALGLHSAYRWERLSGRYRRIDDERSRPRSVYALADEAGLDLWALVRRRPEWVPFADAVYGSATYLPLAEGAVFEITVSASGLVARPANHQAARALRAW